MNKLKCLRVARRLRRCYSVYSDAGESHTPVMAREVAEHVDVRDGDTVLDMTFGAGGHSKCLLERCPNVRIIALDRDPVAHGFAVNLQKEYPDRVIPLLGKFSDLPKLLDERGVAPQSLDAIVCDLGASSMQFDAPERGFSIKKPGPLDMRMDAGRVPKQITAADVVNYASENELGKIFKIYGGERQCKVIARAIVQARTSYMPFQSTKDLADLVELVCPKPRLDKLQRLSHPATKVFQAIRIFVNNEINELNYGMFVGNHYLKRGGKMAVLTFHSAEDTVVKRHFQGHLLDHEPLVLSPKYWTSTLADSRDFDRLSKKCWKMDNKKVIVPGKEEVDRNARSRSAKLRVGIKIDEIEL